jgi:hypothetical protein
MKIHEAPYKVGYIRRVCCVCNEFLGYTKAGREYPEDMDLSHSYCPPCLKNLMNEMDEEESCAKNV